MKTKKIKKKFKPTHYLISMAVGGGRREWVMHPCGDDSFEGFDELVLVQEDYFPNGHLVLGKFKKESEQSGNTLYICEER